MSISSRPLSSDFITTLQDRQTRRDIFNKAWSWFIIIVLVAVVVYSVVIQILHRP